jgi:hypothetical protein
MLQEQTESTSTDGDVHEGQGGTKPSRKISVDEINKVSGLRQRLSSLQCSACRFQDLFFLVLDGAASNPLLGLQVQGMIERCLQSYMNQTEIITTLHLQANIDPGFTSLGMFCV